MGQDHSRTPRSRPRRTALSGASAVAGVALAGLAATIMSTTLTTHAVGDSPETLATASHTSAQAAAQTNVLLNDEFTGLTTESRWTDGQAFGQWRVVFAGYGSVSAPKISPRLLRISPKAATAPDATHAGLVVSKTSFTQRCVNVETRMMTRKQLRQGSAPNPWETGWLIWDYLDNEHFTYLALKTNGWELGKRDPAYPGGQRFLATGSTPAALIGQWQTAKVTRQVNSGSTAATMVVRIGGVKLATFTDTERPYVAGRIGMYSEDATVDIDRMTLTTC